MDLHNNCIQLHIYLVIVFVRGLMLQLSCDLLEKLIIHSIDELPLPCPNMLIHSTMSVQVCPKVKSQ